jgi:hypothetical protein
MARTSWGGRVSPRTWWRATTENRPQSHGTAFAHASGREREQGESETRSGDWAICPVPPPSLVLSLSFPPSDRSRASTSGSTSRRPPVPVLPNRPPRFPSPSPDTGPTSQLGDDDGRLRLASAGHLSRGVTLGEASEARRVRRAATREVRRRTTSRIASQGCRRASLGIRRAPLGIR